MKNAVGYIRVSTRHQGESGCGLLGQEAAIREFARVGGYELMAVEKDICSAREPSSLSDRPGLGSAVAIAKQTDAIIIVWDASRISRNTVSYSRGMDGPMPEIIVVKGNALSASAGMAAEVARAEIEADHLIKRTTLGMKRARGRRAVFGNSVNLPVAREKGVLANVRRANEFSVTIGQAITLHRSAGALTMSEIAAALNADGLRSPYGKTWTKENIRNTLKRIAANSSLALTQSALDTAGAAVLLDQAQLPASDKKISG